MRILGIDPGLATLGYGIVDKRVDKNLTSGQNLSGSASKNLRLGSANLSALPAGKAGRSVPSKKFICVDYGIISTPKEMAIGERLEHIQEQLRLLLRLYKPDAVCVETLFFFRNQKTIIQIGQVHGVLALTFHQERIPLYRYAPLQIKNVLTGSGKAEKKHVEREVKKMLGIRKKISPDDIADGLAVALCHFLAQKIKTPKALTEKKK